MTLTLAEELMRLEETASCCLGPEALSADRFPCESLSLSLSIQDDVPKYVTSVCFAANRDVITGDSTGSILVWSPDDDDIFRIDRQASVAMKFAHKVGH